MPAICSYCKTEFYDKGNLNKHQRTSKYCIKIQLEKEPNLVANHESYECEYCKKKLTTKKSLTTHYKTCKTKNQSEKTEENELKLVKEEMKKLKDELVQLKEKPLTVINNTHNTDNSIKTINNYSSLLDCTPENVTEKFVKHYNTVKHLLKGDQKQLANMTIEHLLSGTDQPMYYVTDRSRNKFMYTDQENNEKEDANANLLRKLVYKGLKPIINDLYKKELLRLNNDLKKYLRKDDGNMIACIREEIKELEDSYQQTNILKESDDYISQLSKCLPSSIKDRIFHDSLGLENDDEEDIRFQLELQEDMRMIGEYTVNELREYKQTYNETHEVLLPPEIKHDPKYKDILAFITEK
jgi:hypothetical protein